MNVYINIGFPESGKKLPPDEEDDVLIKINPLKM